MNAAASVRGSKSRTHVGGWRRLALVFGLMLAPAAWGCASDQAARQATLQAQEARQKADQAEQAAERARLAAQQAQIAADRARRAVDDATREINRVADHVDRINRDREDNGG